MIEQLRPEWDAAERRKLKSGRPCETGGLEDHLLIMLIYYRCYITQDFMGHFYRVASPTDSVIRATLTTPKPQSSPGW